MTVLGDLNASICKRSSLELVGPWGLDKRNEREERFTAENQFVIATDLS